MLIKKDQSESLPCSNSAEYITALLLTIVIVWSKPSFLEINILNKNTKIAANWSFLIPLSSQPDKPRQHMYNFLLNYNQKRAL